MSSTVEALEAEALQLSAAERARLVERLIASLDADPDVDEAWAAEVERRNAEIESGAVALVSGPEALVFLFRPETGEPLGVMDGRLITEMRTRAVSAADQIARALGFSSLQSSQSSDPACRHGATLKRCGSCARFARSAFGAPKRGAFAL